jgi:hypothetical protein
MNGEWKNADGEQREAVRDEPVRAGDRRTASSGRGWAPRHHAGSGRIKAETKGADLGGTGRVARRLTRCHECHDCWPPNLSPSRGDKNVSLTDPSPDASFDASLGDRTVLPAHYPPGNTKLLLTPLESNLESNARLLWTKFENNRTRLKRSQPRWVRILAVFEIIASGPANELKVTTTVRGCNAHRAACNSRFRPKIAVPALKCPYLSP